MALNQIDDIAAAVAGKAKDRAADGLQDAIANVAPGNGWNLNLGKNPNNLPQANIANINRPPSSASNRIVTKAGEELRSLNLKGWRKGKGAPHFTKHGPGMGYSTLKEYTDAAIAFSKQGSNVIESKVGNLIYKFDHDTARILIVSAKERTLVSFYKANNGLTSFKEAMQKHVKVLENLP